MERQTDLFNPQEEADYCFDACVFLNFLKLGDEPYSMDVMEGAFEYIEEKMKSGKIISTIAVFNEIKKWEDKVPGLKDWLHKNKPYFIKEDLAQALAMKPIIKKYEIYATDKGDYGDLTVIGMAKSRNLIVVTSEKRKDQHRETHPKIPNVSEEFGVDCLNVIEFLRKEGIVLQVKPSISQIPSITQPVHSDA
jgi:hypothetical protein